MKHPKLRWKGVPVILATNILPDVMMEPKQKANEEDWEFNMRKNDHIALVTRCKLANLTTSHKNGDVFPYDEKELAIYMYHYINKQQPFEEFSPETNITFDEELEDHRKVIGE